MQQLVFSNRHTSAHFAHILQTSNPCSVRTCSKPFGWPSGSVIFWTFPQCSGAGLELGMTVSCCIHCFPPSDLFISKALSASEPKDAWADD
jgi:hypothetical protein